MYPADREKIASGSARTREEKMRSSDRMTFAGLTCVVALAAAPAFAQSAAEHGQRLLGAEIRRTHFGNTGVGSNPNGSTWRIFTDRNGNARILGRSGNGNPLEDRGRMIIRDDANCVTWQTIRRGELCFVVHRNGDTFTTLNADGSVNARYRIEPGNPYGL
jgi:hypothetical protein